MIIDNKRNLKKPRTVRANVQTYGLKGGNQNDNQNQIKIKLNKTKTEKKKKEKQSRDSPWRTMKTDESSRLTPIIVPISFVLNCMCSFFFALHGTARA